MSIARARINIPFLQLIQFIIYFIFAKPLYISRFLEHLKEFFCNPRVLLYSQARSALFELLSQLSFQENSEFLMSPIHVADFINIPRYHGLKPVLVDTKPDSLYPDISEIKAAITAETKVLMLAHLAGYCGNLEEIAALCKEKGIFFIEDCSQAYSGEYNGTKLGYFGDATIYSMSMLKSVCTLTGGILTLKDDDLYSRLEKSLKEKKVFPASSVFKEWVRHIFFSLALNPFLFSIFTFPTLKILEQYSGSFAKIQKINKKTLLLKQPPKSLLRCKIRPCQAKLGLFHMATLNKRELLRQQYGNILRDAILSNPHLCDYLPKKENANSCSFWQFPLIIKRHRENLIKYLKAHNIDSSPMLLSALAGETSFKPLFLKAPESVSTKNKILFIPTYPELCLEQILYIANTMKNYIPEDI